jgi:hypothetical protein
MAAVVKQEEEVPILTHELEDDKALTLAITQYELEDLAMWTALSCNYGNLSATPVCQILSWATWHAPAPIPAPRPASAQVVAPLVPQPHSSLPWSPPVYIKLDDDDE